MWERRERRDRERRERWAREREREREREEKEVFILCFVGAWYSNKEAQLYQAFHRFKDKETGAITLASLRKMLGTHSQKCSLYRLYTVNALGRWLSRISHLFSVLFWPLLGQQLSAGEVEEMVRSAGTECVFLLQNVFSYYRMCSLKEMVRSAGTTASMNTLIYYSYYYTYYYSWNWCAPQILQGTANWVGLSFVSWWAIACLWPGAVVIILVKVL